MPLFVDEVVILVEVNNPGPKGNPPGPATTEDKRALIAECVERVLEILAEREER